VSVRPAPTDSALHGLVTWQEAVGAEGAIAAALALGRKVSADVLRLLIDAHHVIVTGAGSSYYLARAVAAAARETTGRRFLAAPLSELILRPMGVLAKQPQSPEPVVIISRSGRTTEALAAVDRMRELGRPTVAVSCRDESPLTKQATHKLVIPDGDESAVVMTRSFASMLALLLRIVAEIGEDEMFVNDLDRLPHHWHEAAAAAAVGHQLGQQDCKRIVVLGGGSAAGIADEWALKLIETSQVAVNAYEPLEFRHGPISVCEPGVLVVGLIGGSGASEESRVLDEAAALGATTWTIARDHTEIGDRSAYVSLIGSHLHPAARLPLLLLPAHALALTVALTRGLDPDVPRHLGQVVLLTE
jgi:glutamine---fructose-6-phosphate transaminase (isomerizing)